VWEYRWFTLDGPLNTATVRAFGLGGEVRPAGVCPHELFMQLEACLRDITPGGERRAAVVAFSLLARACGSRPVIRREDDAVQALMDRIEARFADPSLALAAEARDLGQNRTSLSRRFRRRAGRSPQAYVNLLRLQKAMSLLKETDLRVTEVAWQSGYRDPNYFARMVRRQCGMEPTRFREE
jgi:AraC-like DNA-binding protein